jgi:hypothetical protein
MSKRTVLRIVTDPTRPEAGPFLASYDVDACGGIGSYTATSNPAEALAWPSVREAIEAYRTVSTVHPVGEDGQPNRPLTALTVTLETLED